MGCDIHVLVERKVGDKWVMVNRLEGKAIDRNYRRFAALAGVRGDGPAAKGLPKDISESGKLFADDWDGYGHSHSWNTVNDAAEIFLSTEYEPTDYANLYPASYFFDVDDNEENHRIVYWFDN